MNNVYYTNYELLINSSIRNYFEKTSMRNKLGGYPYEIKKEGNKTVIKFFPQSPNAKDPNLVRFQLQLSSEDIKNLKKILP